MKQALSILMGLIVLTCGIAQAGEEEGYITAEEMGSWCLPYKNATVKDSRVILKPTADSEVCFGAFMALQQLSATSKPDGTGTVLNQCIPADVKLTELIKVFMRYMDEHPEVGHRRFTHVALASFRKAYPCGP